MILSRRRGSRRRGSAALFAAAVAVAALLASPASASLEHSDIEFSYVAGKIDVEFGSQGRVFEGKFPLSGLVPQFTDDPGFLSEKSEGLGVNRSDIIGFNVAGPLRMHDGTGFSAPGDGVSLNILDGANKLLSVSATTPTLRGIVDQADGDGNIHKHLAFTLNPSGLGSAAYGAYGLELSLTTTASGVADSETFFVVFNFGLAESAFESAVAAYAALVPAPAAPAVACLAGLPGLLVRRRV